MTQKSAVEQSTTIYSHRELEAMDIDDLDRIAFGCNDGDILYVDPASLVIKYPCDLDNPEEKFRLGGMAWVRSVSFDEPIHVSIGEDGRKYLEDGHHRRFSAIKQGISLQAQIEIRANPVKVILARQDASAQKPSQPGRREAHQEDGLSM
jgi:hypothetical protein